MNYRPVLLWCTAFILISSCRQATSFTVDEKKNVEDNVRKMLHEYYADVKREGLVAEFKYLDSSADFFWVPPGYAGAISFDSVATVLRKTAPMLALVDNTFDTLHVVPLSSELASYTARVSSTVTDTAGHTSSSTLLETGIVIKRRDGWKLLSGHTSVLP